MGKKHELHIGAGERKDANQLTTIGFFDTLITVVIA